MELIVVHLPIKAGWWDASHLAEVISIASTSLQQRQYISLLCFCNVRICTNLDSNTVCNKSGFYGGEWWSERLHCHMYFPQNNHLLS